MMSCSSVFQRATNNARTLFFWLICPRWHEVARGGGGEMGVTICVSVNYSVCYVPLLVLLLL